MIHQRFKRAARWLLTTLILTGLSGQVSVNAAQYLKLATTTSVENSGLLKKLVPPFEEAHKIKVKIIAVGSGNAFKLAERGDVDLIFVHDQQQEERFILEGLGVNRRATMFNDFILLGPENDPAGVKKAESASLALAKIAQARSLFVSRGDNSGTHSKELQLWQSARIEPSGSWYLSAGQGMGATLVMADQKGAYTISDKGTYLAFRQKITLAVLYSGDPALKNYYSVIVTNPARHPQINYKGALAFISWVTSPAGQKIIENYILEGQPLFHPAALP